MLDVIVREATLCQPRSSQHQNQYCSTQHIDHTEGLCRGRRGGGVGKPENAWESSHDDEKDEVRVRASGDREAICLHGLDEKGGSNRQMPSTSNCGRPGSVERHLHVRVQTTLRRYIDSNQTDRTAEGVVPDACCCLCICLVSAAAGLLEPRV